MSAPVSAEHSNSVRKVYELGLKTLEAGDTEEAEMICRRALATCEQDPNLLCLLAEILLKQKRTEEARKYFRNTLKRHPDYPRALEGMGLALLADSQPGPAIKFLQQAAVAVPGRAATHFALGKALAATGRGAEADRAYEKSFQLNPTHGALARAAEAQRNGDMERAEKALRELLARDPDNVTALRMLGSIALEANRLPAAYRLLERAVELAPGFILAWNDLASLYVKEDRYDDALEKVEHAISLDPLQPGSYVIKGNILSRAQRHEASLAAYQQTLELNPGHGGALAGKGHVLKTIGRQEESIEAYRKCIQAHPRLGEAYWSLANLKTLEFNEREVKVMHHMVEDAKLPDEPKVNFFLSLGKHYENQENFDQAFQFYRRGNELRRGHEMYDPVQTQVIHDRIIKVFTTGFFAQRSGWGDPDPSPILVVGLPRSGSTLIEQILASHSQVEGTMELPDLSRTIREINRSRKKDRVEYPEATTDLGKEDVNALGRFYLESTQRYRTGKRYFIDKMPNNFSNTGFLHLILPNAKVINARRHPMDSCMGCYKQLFFKGQSFTYDQFELGQYYLQYQRIMDHWHQVLPGRVLDVHYEQMVLDQEAQTRRLLEFCGLPWEQQCLRFYETDRAVNTASSEQVRQPIYTKSLNFWKNYESHLGELIGILEPLLVKLPGEDRPKSLR